MKTREGEQEKKEVPGAGESNFAKNFAVLSRVLGVHISVLKVARLEHGAPRGKANGRHPIDEWQMFLRKRGTLDRIESSNARERLKDREAELRVSILERQEEAFLKEWVPTSHFRRTVANILNGLRRRIRESEDIPEAKKHNLLIVLTDIPDEEMIAGIEYDTEPANTKADFRGRPRGDSKSSG